MFMKFLIKQLNTLARVNVMNKKHGSHFKTYFVMYLIGLGIYLLTLLAEPFNLVNINNTLLIVIYYLVLFLSGVHVIGEGIYDTIHDTIKKERFHHKVHLLKIGRAHV